jgi:hypothetical protein
MRASGDRRAHERFDVVGALWGVLELPQTARIHNVSSTGMLIDASAPAVLDSMQTIRVLVDGEMVSVDTRVRHVQPEPDGRRYLIGLEFQAVPTTVIASIEQLAASEEIEVFHSATSEP